ncbi:hypothetical protein Tco_0162157 [Tanacetum coccineum]
MWDISEEMQANPLQLYLTSTSCGALQLEGMPSILLEPSDHKSRDRVLSCGRAPPHIRRAARRFLTLAGYDKKCVTPNAMKSKALVDLLAHFPCGEYEYAPPSELSAVVLEEANKFQKTCLQYTRAMDCERKQVKVTTRGSQVKARTKEMSLQTLELGLILINTDGKTCVMDELDAT